jgi:hypothetical protein
MGGGRGKENVRKCKTLKSSSMYKDGIMQGTASYCLAGQQGEREKVMGGLI